MNENEISRVIVDCCFKVHTTLGPGLFESVYEEVLSYEIVKRNLFIERQKAIPVIYDQLKMELGFRADIIVEKKSYHRIKIN